ncbi:MAG: signal peptidase I [Ruminococcaceae bacterium]|nr:signal peptidase I [Oscillospiraceae bacterium]
MNAESAQKTKKPSWFENVLDFVEIAVFALVMVAVLFAFFIRVVAVDGDSMNDTLIHGDNLILVKAFYTPDYGDIVVISREGNTPLIKRVIAKENDTIYIDPVTHEVFLNDKVLNEPYVHYDNLIYDMKAPVTVPEGHVFVMGDHRNNSYDSRKESVGCVSVDDIVGKAVWRFLPAESFGGIYDNME